MEADEAIQTHIFLVKFFLRKNVQCGGRSQLSVIEEDGVVVWEVMSGL